MSPALPSPPQVALLQLPWGELGRPSIQLGLLKRLLEREESLPSRIVCLDLALARRIGPWTYARIKDQMARHFGEWAFARLLFGGELPDTLEQLRQRYRGPARLDSEAWETLGRAIREELPRFVEDCPRLIEEQLGTRPAVVGLSCTFDQLLAALCIARTLKEAWPGLRVILGGSQVSDSAGPALLSAFPWIDWIVDGDAEPIAAPLFRALLDDGPEGQNRGWVRAGHLDDLDRAPAPDYRDYLAQRPDELVRSIQLPVELSRGCAKAHTGRRCLFCGLYPGQAPARPKSARRIVEELRRLSAETWLLDFCATDADLPRAALSALEELACDHDLTLFSEMRVGHPEETVARLARAGLRQVQLGVEALSTPLLRRMRKGSTLLDNLAALKTYAEQGVSPFYNLLYGFPGERDSDYQSQLALLPKIHHLPPPLFFIRVNLVRHSPYWHHPERWDLGELRPAASYSQLFPPGLVALEELAFHFESQRPAGASPAVIEALAEGLRSWHAAARAGARLSYRKAGERLILSDSRDPERPRAMALVGAKAKVLRALQSPRGTDELAGRTGLDEETARAALDELIELQLVVAEGGQAMSLALPWQSPALAVPEQAPLHLDGGEARR